MRTNPKSEIRRKSEGRIPKQSSHGRPIRIRISEFGFFSGFALRIPDLRMSALLFAFLCSASQVIAQTNTAIPLWPAGAPDAFGKEEKDIPTLTPFFPDASIATGAAMIICPGGGYGSLAPYEGQDYARFLNRYGI